MATRESTETANYSPLRLASKDLPGIEVLPGMSWFVGADRRASAQHLWMSRIVIHRQVGVSPVHHHAESEAAIYALRGRSAYFFGPELRERIDLEEGDFLFIPAWTIHAEAVLSTPVEIIMARSTSSPKSVNLPDLCVPNEVLQAAGVAATRSRE